MNARLETRNLSAGYAGSAVLQGVSIELSQGELVALLGANGAGKTTLMRAITGLLALEDGDVLVDGESLAAVATPGRVERGIALSPEGRQLFSELSVEKCLALGSFAPHARPHRAERMEEVFTLFPRLRDRRRQRAGTMSGGEQQMVAIGRALMSCPKFLLLDEPSLGLSPLMVETLLEATTEIVKRGMGVLLVEQNVRAALRVASRAYVLAEGRVMMAGPSNQLLADETFLGKFLGHEVRPTGERLHA